MHDQIAEGFGDLADGRGDDVGGADADQSGDDGGHQDVDLRLLADGFAALRGDDGHEQYRQRAACAAQQIAGIAHGRQGEEHHGRRLEGIADGDGHGGAAHERGQAADGVGHLFRDLAAEEVDVELGADGVEDGADQQRAEQTLGHSAQGVDAIPLGGEDDVFAFEEGFEFFHGDTCFTCNKNGIQVS